MNFEAYKIQLKETVVDEMLDFMGDGEDCGFTREDVKACEALILQYLTNLATMENPTDEAIMTEVKTLVLALNKLNAATDDSLIETMEREAIWEIIQGSALECGLTDPGDDVTEEWREW